MADAREVRRGEVDALPVLLIDGLLSLEETGRLYQWLVAQPFTRSEFARPDTQAFLHWAYNLGVADCERLPFYKSTLAAIRSHFPERGPQRCYRTYCNLASYGDMLFTHTDSQPGVEELTALWYVAPRWDIEWGGETILFDSSGDAQFVASPRPGRLLLFDGRIRHAGRPPNRVCVIPRLTFAMKFEPVPQAAR